MVATGENLFTREQLKAAQLPNFSYAQLQIMLTNFAWQESQVPHVSVETESSFCIRHFRVPKLDPFSEQPPEGSSLCRLCTENTAFKVRVLCLFLNVSRVNIPLCEYHYSAFIKLIAWGKSQLLACAKGRRKEAKGRRDSHAEIVHRGRDRAVRHSGKA